MPTKTRRPDVVLIVLDTLRADRLSCYGHPQETTPHLDALAAQGVRFERAISPAQWTIPAHASIFTGEFPSAHGTTQIFDKHSPERVTLAEHLSSSGYLTVGLCNNPLLGVLDNGLDRGFQEFYNYGGVLPNRPDPHPQRPNFIKAVKKAILRQLRKLAGPIETLFAEDNALLSLALHPRLVPLWERNINFKGNTRKSLLDLLGYLKRHHQQEDAPPLMVYLNLMETHLPFRVPHAFSQAFAPSFHEDREAKAWMQSFNYRTYDWISPVARPFSEAQHRVLNEMYNAEVAYEDHLLRGLLDYLDQPQVHDNTLVIITSDHGEGLDHHGYVGHSLVTYEDLVRVPLIVRFPNHDNGGTVVDAPVSTRRIFHTVMEAAGIPETLQRFRTDTMDPAPSLVQPSTPDGPDTTFAGFDPEAIAALSLQNTTAADTVWAEAYPPLTLVHLIEKQDPAIVDRFRCLAVRRTIYEGTRKLITIDDQPEELYDVSLDPAELQNRIENDPKVAEDLDRRLRERWSEAKSRWPSPSEGTAPVNFAENQRISERLRRLGYIE